MPDTLFEICDLVRVSLIMITYHPAKLNKLIVSFFKYKLCLKTYFAHIGASNCVGNPKLVKKKRIKMRNLLSYKKHLGLSFSLSS